MLLTLDIASAVGWAAGHIGTRPVFGSIRFGDGAPPGQIFDDFDVWLWDKIDELQPEFIYRESAFISPKTNARTVQILYGLQALVLRACYRQKIVPRSATPMQAYEFFVGGKLPSKAIPGETKSQLKARRRNAKKTSTVFACKGRGFAVQDDNAADAVALWHYAENDIAPKMAAARPATAGPLFR